MTLTNRQLHRNTMSLVNQSTVLSAPHSETSLSTEQWNYQRTLKSKNPVSLDSLVEEIAGVYTPLANRKYQRLITSTQTVAPILGSAELLAHAFSILLHNAIEATPPGGLILLTLEPQIDSTIISISDTSLGMPSVERNQAVNEITGFGTGHSEDNISIYRLQVVNVIARLHNAELHLGDNNPGLHAKLHFRKRASD